MDIGHHTNTYDIVFDIDLRHRIRHKPTSLRCRMSYAKGDLRHRIRLALAQAYDILGRSYDIVGKTYDVATTYDIVYELHLPKHTTS